MYITVVQKRKSAVGAGSFLFFMLLFMSLAYSISVYKTKMVWFGLSACLISLSGILHAVWKKELLMQIDDVGIYDRRLGIGKIKWEDVAEVQLQVTEENRFLCFRMRNPEPYLARLKGKERERVLYHRGLGFQGFNIDVSPVDVNLLELKKLIDVRVGR